MKEMTEVYSENKKKEDGEKFFLINYERKIYGWFLLD